MADSVLTEAERKRLSSLASSGVRYLVIGMSAALLQGARGATEGIDLWFEDVEDVRRRRSATANGIWYPVRSDSVLHESAKPILAIVSMW